MKPDSGMLRDTNVSRETLADLATYVELLKSWNEKINLVSPDTISEIWERHISDCLQLFNLAPRNAKHCVDLGTGGGLPGLVLAIAAKRFDGLRFSMVDSDSRKMVFVSNVVRVLGLHAEAVHGRIDDLPAMNADVVTARALAPLSKLLSFAERHRNSEGICLFLKGENADKELTAASDDWHMDVEKIKSATNPNACILKIGRFSRV